MMTGKRITNVWTVAAVAMGIVGMTAGTVQAQDSVHSFVIQGNAMSNDVAAANNPNGLQITGQVGAWALINTTTPAATDDGVTLTFDNSNGWGGTPGDPSPTPMRAAAIRIYAGLTSGPIPWTLTGLEPNAKYSMIWYNKRNPPGENRHPWSAVTGFDAGNGVGQPAPVDADRDQNFVDVPADGTGTISGFWYYDGTTPLPENTITAVAGVQVWKTVPPVPTGTVIVIR
jgi:hypothetical protein